MGSQHVLISILLHNCVYSFFIYFLLNIELIYSTCPGSVIKIFLLSKRLKVAIYIYGFIIYISEKPTATLSSSPITLYEGDNFTCVCRGEGGNPPANVAWYKDGVQIGVTGKEEQTLTLSNVGRTVSGTYKCVATSHTLTDELVEVKVILDCKYYCKFMRVCM